MPNVMDREQQRDQVIRLLLECHDEKRIQGADPRSRAEQAYQLAKGTFPTWHKVAAYRLAHIRMRHCSGVEELREIDKLFCEAAQLEDRPELAAMAKVFRLAVLHRLRSLSSDATKPQIEETLGQAHRDAVAAVGETRTLAFTMRQRSNQNEGSNAQSIIQTEVFNLLELATYFLGFPYDPLEGLGARYPAETDRSPGWCVLGRGVSKIEMTHALALSELDDRVRDEPRAIWFEFPDTDGQHRPPLELKKESGEESVSHGELALLACLLANEEPSREFLQRRVIEIGRRHSQEASSDDSGYFRQQKQRLKTKLAKLLDRPPASIWTDSESDTLELADDLVVFGAVENSRRFQQ